MAEPTAPLEYNSATVLRDDKAKHTRKVFAPQQQCRAPMTTAQEVGWEAGVLPLQDVGTPFHIRASAVTHFHDAAEKHAWGRSIGGEFSKFAFRKLLASGGFGMGI